MKTSFDNKSFYSSSSLQKFIRKYFRPTMENSNRTKNILIYIYISLNRHKRSDDGI